MPLRAKQGEEDILAFLYDRSAWTALKTQRKVLNLKMPCCGSPAIPKTSQRGTIFFAHAVKHDCFTETESQEHLFLKTLAALAASELGWDVKTEWRGSTPTGETWVADVYCVRGKTQVAFEIQMSRQPLPELLKRQARYKESGIRAAWFASHRVFHKNDIHPNKETPFFIISDPPLPNEPYVESLGLALTHFVKHLLKGHVTWKLTPSNYSLHYLDDTCWKCKKRIRQVYGYSLDVYELNGQTVPHLSTVLFEIAGIVHNDELKKLGEEGKEKKEEAEEAELAIIRKRHGVK